MGRSAVSATSSVSSDNGLAEYRTQVERIERAILGDLHVEEHGDWSTWRDSTDVIGMSMVCAPGAELRWGNFSAGACPDSGVMDRPPSLLDYIIAIDALPDHAPGSLVRAHQSSPSPRPSLPRL